MDAEYRINSLTRLVNDRDGTTLHVCQDDYFGTIATILNLWRQQAEKSPETLNPDFYKTLAEIEKDLVWLQNNYQIKPRIKKRKRMPKGKEINQ